MNPNFWRNKRIFLTGHTGFKGGWLALWLQHWRAQVVGFALPPNTEPNLFTVAQVAEGMTSHFGDIRSLQELQKAIDSARPDIVFHLAAQPLVRYSYAEPIETYATNVMGTANLLEAIRQHNINGGAIRAVVNVTTDKCYENKEWLWGYREDEPMGGYDPYSSSKGCAELISAAYRRSYFEKMGIHLATARAGNVIGGGDWSEDRLIPDILRAWEKDKPVVIRNPLATRPWQHVLEPLSGYLILAEKLYNEGAEFAEAWNFGPEETDAQPVQWIVEKMAEMWAKSGKPAHWQKDTAPQPHEAHYLKLDVSKAKSRLKWRPCLNLESALLLTMQWYRAYLENSNLRALCLSQINQFSGEENG